MKRIQAPKPEEHAAYYLPFVVKVRTDISVLDQLKLQRDDVLDLLKNTPLEHLQTPYAEGKWSILDLVQHLIDCERVFVYRAMRFARNDRSPLPFFDENAFAEQARLTGLNVKKLMAEYKTTRQATITFFNNLTPELLKRTGIASQFTMSVRACVWIIAGHEKHHMEVIHERYRLS